MARPTHHQEASSDSPSDQHQEVSESEEESNMLKVGEQMLQASRKRRDSRRKMIESEHKKRVKDVQGKISKLYGDRKGRVQKIQKSQWSRLSALLTKRKSIEARIFTHLKAIEATRSNLSSTLDAVFEGRLEEIAEIHVSEGVLD